MQAPIVKIGTEFPNGTVTDIKRDRIVLNTPQGVRELTFTEVENFITLLESLQNDG